jgi:hypothetical protein
MRMRSLLVAAALLGGAGSAGAQTQEQAVATLRDLAQAVRAEDYERAAALMQAPPAPAKRDQEMKRLLWAQEISEPGLEVLARDGRWGQLDAVVPPREAAKMAQRAGVPLDRCYGLVLKGARAALAWTGDAFKVIRVESIGRLVPTAR